MANTDDGIHNVLSIGGITLVSTAEETMQIIEDERHDDMPLEAGDTGDNYVVKRTVRQKSNDEGTRCSVRWYC